MFYTQLHPEQKDRLVTFFAIIEIITMKKRAITSLSPDWAGVC
jgi:hypothetical protein